MMSGYLYWSNGYPSGRGVHGRFWSSTPVSYTLSRNLYFNSTNVDPKDIYIKPNGFSLRCVALLLHLQLLLNLPKLFLWKLKCPPIHPFRV
ncbi:hypothetical protein IKF63_01645 [Candidatus Saccharibacteria bacterium]|nr:hypothetical protein [Candidatus Saccharibacteria bacterium]